jgi:murein DD-endopeptidase MepM/ murein hydrolase activator NlpD
MTRRRWPLLLLPLLTAASDLPPLWAQSPMPELVPQQVPVPDVRPPAPVPVPAQAPASSPPSLAYPLAQPADSFDPWGWRYSERRSAWRMHTGIDLAAQQGTAVLAAGPGRVVLVESISGYGNTVLLEHGAGWQTLYAHLHGASVVPGQWLEPGDPLGTVGMTGSASGPHLHFELRRQGPELLALDPTPHLPPLLPPPALPPVVATINP